jgi:hypothetical protein
MDDLARGHAPRIGVARLLEAGAFLVEQLEEAERLRRLLRPPLL